MHFNRNIDTMKSSNKFLLLTSIIVSIHFSLGGLSVLTFNQAIHKVQDSGSNCVLQMAKEFFQISSNICIVTSGLNNVTNMQIAKTTDRMIMDKLMKEYHWTISTFISGGSRISESVCIKKN